MASRPGAARGWLAAPLSPPNPAMIRRIDGYESCGLQLKNVDQLSKEVGQPQGAKVSMDTTAQQRERENIQ